MTSLLSLTEWLQLSCAVQWLFVADGGVGIELGKDGNCRAESLQDCVRSEHFSLSFDRGQSQQG